MHGLASSGQVVTAFASRSSLKVPLLLLSCTNPCAVSTRGSEDLGSPELVATLGDAEYLLYQVGACTFACVCSGATALMHSTSTLLVACLLPTCRSAKPGPMHVITAR